MRQNLAGEATTSPRELRLDLWWSLKTGQTIEIKTESGSTYWITLARDAQLSSNAKHVFGVAITSNSSFQEGPVVAPAETWIARYVTRGERLLCSRADTSPVVSWKIL